MRMDRESMAAAVRAFLEALGQRVEGPDLGDTPERVARAWAEDLVSGYAQDPAELLSWTAAPEGSGAVAVRDVSFASVCIHHLLPFFGHAHVAYLPGRRLAGLSKIGRVVEAHARRLQIQERLSAEIADTLQRVLEPRGVLVVLDAEHTCMTLRGGRKFGSRMRTLAATGVYDTDDQARREALILLTGDGAPRGDD